MLTVYGLVGGASRKIEHVHTLSAAMLLLTPHTNRQKVDNDTMLPSCRNPVLWNFANNFSACRSSKHFINSSPRTWAYLFNLTAKLFLRKLYLKMFVPNF